MIASYKTRLLRGEEGSSVVNDMRKYYKTKESCSLSSKISLVRRHFINHKGNENKHKKYESSLENFKNFVLQDEEASQECKQNALKFVSHDFSTQCKISKMHASKKFCFNELTGKLSNIDREFKKIHFLPDNMKTFVASELDLEECRKHVNESKKKKHFNACIIEDGNAMLDKAREIVDKHAFSTLFAKDRMFKFDGSQLTVRFPHGFESVEQLSEKKRWTKLDQDAVVITAQLNKWTECEPISSNRIILKVDEKFYVASNSAPSYVLSEHVIALLLVCGRRSAELLNGRSSFEQMKNNPHCVVFDGQLKKRLPGEEQPYAIPLLIDSKTFCNSLSRMRSEQGDVSELSNDEISVRYHSNLSRKLGKLFPEVGKVHNLRGIYIHMSFRTFRMNNLSLNGAIMTYLGHESVEVSLAYSHIVLEKFEVSGPKKRITQTEASTSNRQSRPSS